MGDNNILKQVLNYSQVSLTPTACSQIQTSQSQLRLSARKVGPKSKKCHFPI